MSIYHDFYSKVPCPFEPLHRVPEASLTRHLLECTSPNKANFERCQYNFSHWVVRQPGAMNEHHRNCPEFMAEMIAIKHELLRVAAEKKIRKAAEAAKAAKAAAAAAGESNVDKVSKPIIKDEASAVEANAFTSGKPELASTSNATAPTQKPGSSFRPLPDGYTLDDLYKQQVRAKELFPKIEWKKLENTETFVPLTKFQKQNLKTREEKKYYSKLLSSWRKWKNACEEEEEAKKEREGRPPTQIPQFASAPEEKQQKSSEPSRVVIQEEEGPIVKRWIDKPLGPYHPYSLFRKDLPPRLKPVYTEETKHLMMRPKDWVWTDEYPDPEIALAAKRKADAEAAAAAASQSENVEKVDPVPSESKADTPQPPAGRRSSSLKRSASPPLAPGWGPVTTTSNVWLPKKPTAEVAPSPNSRSAKRVPQLQPTFPVKDDDLCPLDEPMEYEDATPILMPAKETFTKDVPKEEEDEEAKRVDLLVAYREQIDMVTETTPTGILIEI